MNYMERAKLNILMLDTQLAIVKKLYDDYVTHPSHVEQDEVFDEISNELTALATRANQTAYIFERMANDGE